MTTEDGLKPRPAELIAAERLYLEAEWLNAWAYTLGKANQQAQLEEGLQLLRQDQPDMAQLAQIQYIGRDVLTESLTEITARIIVPGDKFSGDSLVVLNALGWDRIDVIQISAEIRGAVIDAEGNVEAMTADRESQLTQPILDDRGNPARLIAVRVPAYGYHTYILRGGLPGQMDDNSLFAQRQRLESADFRLTFDNYGEINSLYDKAARQEIVARGQTLNQLVSGSTQPVPVRTVTNWRVIESGPIRAAIEITRQIGDDTIVQKIMLWAHTRRIDFEMEVKWHAFQPLSQALFPLNAKLRGGNYAVALLIDDHLELKSHNHVISLSLLERNPASEPITERGTSRFTYRLYVNPGDWRETEMNRRSTELSAPLRVVRQPPTDRIASDINPNEALPPAYSFLSIPNPNTVIDRVKVAANGDGLIVQVYGIDSQIGPASLHFTQIIRNAIEVDWEEKPIVKASLVINGRALYFDLRSRQRKAFRINLA